MADSMSCRCIFLPLTSVLHAMLSLGVQDLCLSPALSRLYVLDAMLDFKLTHYVSLRVHTLFSTQHWLVMSLDGHSVLAIGHQDFIQVAGSRQTNHANPSLVSSWLPPHQGCETPGRPGAACKCKARWQWSNGLPQLHACCVKGMLLLPVTTSPATGADHPYGTGEHLQCRQRCCCHRTGCASRTAAYMQGPCLVSGSHELGAVCRSQAHEANNNSICLT
jgi:hypothetical protein